MELDTQLITDILFATVMFLLLACSAMFSGAEVAFFALSPKQVKKLEEGEHKKAIRLIKDPERLLATILISNNFANVGVVTLSTYLANRTIHLENEVLVFLIQVVLVTFLILLFGEILPKLFANRARVKVAIFTATPLDLLSKIFKPLVKILISSSSLIKNKLKGKGSLSIDELSKALELTEKNEIDEEKDLLEGIVRFTYINTSDILTPRINIIAVDENWNFEEVKNSVIDSGFSRMPVYKENLDDITGVLYIKDLLPYLKENKSFKWNKLVRPAYFVPENKKINILLEEFQEKKVHLAIVVDEYGGTSGIVTMEDILEEIVGEINDEFDETNNNFIKTKNNSYIFKASILLNDFEKIAGIEHEEIEKISGEAETLAGLILEIHEDMPQAGEAIIFNNYKFTIMEADKRKISKVRFESIKK